MKRLILLPLFILTLIPALAQEGLNAYNNPSAVITPSRGMQRGVGKRFSFELLLGFSFRYNSRAESGTGSPAIGAKFGYIIY